LRESRQYSSSQDVLYHGIIIIIIIAVVELKTFTWSRLLMGLGSVRGRKFILSPEVKGHVLGICILYDTFVRVLLFAPHLRCFWLKLIL